MSRKHIDIFKLEDRVLFDAAGAAEIVDAAEQAAQGQVSESDAQAAEERDALKNAPPENPVAGATGGGGRPAAPVEPEKVSDIDAAVDAIIEGEIAQPEAADSGAPADAVSGDVDAADYDADAAVDHAGDMTPDSADVDQMVADADGGHDIDGDIDDFVNVDADADADAGQDHVALDGSVAFVDAFAPVVEESPRELVIINSSVLNPEKIIDSLADNTDVLILKDGQDALDQINDYLDANPDVKYGALHIVSHGNAGYFVLNGEVIDAESVASDPASWANIGQHLTDDGDIMIYGCNVAGNLDGQMLISNIAQLTGADVAASVDDTGSRGDWDLEYSVGVIDVDSIYAHDYEYTLTGYNVTEAAAENKEGTLLWAFGQAHSGDEIILSVDAAAKGNINFNGDLTLSSKDGSFSATFSDGALTVTNGTFTISSNTTVVINSGASFSGDMVNYGTVTLSGSIASGSTIWSSGKFEISNANAAIQADVTNYGTINANGGQWAEIENYGSFNLNSSSVRWTSFDNSGTLAVNVYYSRLNASNFTNSSYGELLVNSDVVLSDVMTLGGTVTVETGGTLSILTQGSATSNTSHTGGVELNHLVNNGTVSVGSGALLHAGRLTNTASLNVSEDGTLSLADNVSGPIGGTVLVYGGNLYCASSLAFSNLERWYKVDSDTTLSDYLADHGLVFTDNLNFFITDNATMTLDVMYADSEYSYEVRTGSTLIVAVASEIGSLEVQGTVSVTAPRLDITGAGSGSGEMNADGLVVYHQSGYVIGGAYNGGLSLIGSSMWIYDDLTVSGIFTAKSTTGSVSVSIGSDATLTILGQVADAYTTTYSVQGTMNVETQAVKVAFSGSIYVGQYGRLNLAAEYLSCNGYVGLNAGYGAINITGDYTEFTAGFSDAASWYNYSGYITAADAAGLHETGYQVASSISSYKGTVTIDTTGEVVFSGSHEVVIVNEFNIAAAGKVTFNATLAVAAGNFTVSRDVVELYFNDVYVSTQYRTSRETHFDISAQDTVFNGTFNLYAISPRNYSSDGTNDAGEYIWNRYTDYFSGVDSSGNKAIVLSAASQYQYAYALFDGDKVTFNSSVSLSSAYGMATFTNQAGAMTFNGSVTNDASGRTPGDGGSAALQASGGTLTVGYMVNYSYFYLGDNTTVNGAVTNTATNITNYNRQDPFAYFTIGSNNNFSTSSSFSNNGSYLFVAVDVLGGGNNFSGTFTNTATLSVNPGPDAAARNVFENLINNGTGEVTFANSGDAAVNITNAAKLTVADTSDGIQFTGLSNSGNASILADVNFLREDFGTGVVNNSGTLFINGVLNSELSLSNSGTTTIAGAGSLVQGDISNTGTFNFNANATIEGEVSNSGLLNVNAGATGMVFSSLINAASGTVQLNARSTLNSVTNSGSVTINAPAQDTVIGYLDNKAGASVIATAGIIFGLDGFESGVENAGTITIANSVSCVNGATFINYQSGILYLNQTLDPNQHENRLDITNEGRVEVSGTVHLGEVTNASGATIRLTTESSMLCFDGTLENNGAITGTGSVVFRGETAGTGYLALAGARSTITYDAASEVSQQFFATDAAGNYNYNAQVIIQGQYGEVHIDRDMVFNRGLVLNGGNLVVDAGYVFNATSVTLTAGTLTIQNGATFRSEDDLVFDTAITLVNDGIVQLLDGKSVTFAGETSGSGSLLMSGGDITYSSTSAEQYLYATVGEFGEVTLSGGTKVVGFDMNMSSLVNNGADIRVLAGVTLSLGQVTGDGSAYSIFVERDAASGSYGTLKLGSESAAVGTINNSGLVDLTVAAGKSVTAQGIVNAATGTFQANVAGAFDVTGDGSNAGTLSLVTTGSGSVNLDGSIDNSGLLGLSGAAGSIAVSGLVNTGTVNASTGVFTTVDNQATFNVNANDIVLGAFSNTGALNFNTDFSIGDGTFDYSTTPVEIGGTVTVAAGRTLTVASSHQIRFVDTVNVGENSRFVVNSVGTYDASAVALTGGGVYVETMNNQGEVEVHYIGTAAATEAVLQINNVAQNTGRLTALTNGVLLLSQASSVPGEVYAQDGKVYFLGDIPDLSIWLTVTGNASVSSYEFMYSDLYTGKYGFLVTSGSSLTVDTAKASDSQLKYDVKEGGTLIFDVDCNVLGSVALAGTLLVNNGSNVTLTGVTSGTGSVTANGKVTYAASNSAGFGGTYNAGLAVSGSNVKFSGAVKATDVSVSGSNVNFADAVDAGDVSVSGSNVTFGGTVDAGDVSVVGNDVSFNDAVTAGDVLITGNNAEFGGAVSAADVAVDGSAEFAGDVSAADVTVDGSAEFNGAMTATGSLSGAGNVVFDGAVSAAGGANMGAGSLVTYNAGATEVIDGTYDSLTLNGPHTAQNVTVNAEATINGEVDSSGTLLFGASGNVVQGADGWINSTGRVEYAGRGDVVSGTYQTLVVSGSDQTAGDVTIEGSLLYTGSGLEVDGILTNNGQVVLEEAGNSANFNNSVFNNGLFQVNNDGNRFTGTFVNNDRLEVAGDDNIFARVTNNGQFTLSGDHNFFSEVYNQKDFSITGDSNRIVALTNISTTRIDGDDNSFGSITNSGNGVIWKNGQMWMVSGVGAVGDGFPSQWNLNFSSLAEVLGNELRAAELEELFNQEGPGIFRRRVSTFENTVTDITDALEGTVNYVDPEMTYDEAIFDGADFQDEDYSDVMDIADIFSDQLSAAIEEMVAV